MGAHSNYQICETPLVLPLFLLDISLSLLNFRILASLSVEPVPHWNWYPCFIWGWAKVLVAMFCVFKSVVWAKDFWEFPMYCSFLFFSLSPVLQNPFCFAFILSSFIFWFSSKPSPWIICFPGYFDFVSFSNLIGVYPVLTQFLILLHHDRSINTQQYTNER